MSKQPQDTSAEEPDGGNPHIRFRGGPRQGDRPGLLNSSGVKIAGVGMTPFVKPGTGAMYRQLGARAASEALADAGLEYRHVQQAFVGFVYGDSTSGQSALYELGLSGIPIVNVNNNCATGSSSFFLARQAILSCAADCVLALGFEQMSPGALQELYADRPSPLSRFTQLADEKVETGGAPMAIKLFGAAAIEYQQRYGTADEVFAMVSVKARRHAQHNDRAIFRAPVSVEEVLASPRMLGPLTRLQCCPPTCGGAAAILVSDKFAKRHGLDGTVTVRGQAMTTDFPSTFSEGSLIKVVGADLTKEAAASVYEQSGVGPTATEFRDGSPGAFCWTGPGPGGPSAPLPAGRQAAARRR
jgi:sterol carrier protein 2